MNIKILGGGCASCEKLLANTKEAIGNLGIDAEVEYITECNRKLCSNEYAGTGGG